VSPRQAGSKADRADSGVKIKALGAQPAH